MELIHDALSIERVAGRTRAQAMVEGDIMQAGMANVLSVEGRVSAESVEAHENRVTVEGTIELFVMFVDEGGKVDGFTSSSDYKHSVELPGVAPGMRAEAAPSLQELDFTQLDDRTLKVRAVIDLDCTVMERAIVDAMQGAADIRDLEIKPLELDLFEQGDPILMSSVLRESVRIPQGLPPLGNVLNSTANARATGIVIEDGKAAVEGEVRVSTLYTSDGDENAPLQQVQHSLPFGQIFMLDGVVKDAELDLHVRDLNVTAAQDENRSILEVEALLELKLKPKRCISAKALEDAYSPSRNIKAVINPVEIRQSTSQGAGRCMVRDSVGVPEDMPAAARALYMAARPVVTDVEALDERAAIHGVIFGRVVYVCREGSLHGFEAELPFRCEIEAPGMTHSMDAQARVLCESASVSGTGDALDAKLTLECMVGGNSTDRVNILTGLEEMEPGQRPLGVVVYFANKDETRWDIAKRFRIPQSELMECNPDLPERLQSGEKVLLLLRN